MPGTRRTADGSASEQQRHEVALLISCAAEAELDAAALALCALDHSVETV